MIREATDKLAPHEPGWLEKSWEWVKENLPNILSAVAGALALAALIFTGPIALPLLLVGAAIFSGAALGTRISDPAVRESLMDGLTKGEFDADFFSNLVSVGADTLGFVPGLGVAMKGGVGLARAVRTGGTALSLGQKMAVFGSKASEGAREVSSVANPLLERVFRGTSNPAVVIDSIGRGSAGIGMVTAGYGLVSEDEIKGQVGTGIDGARLGVDLPVVPGLLRAAF